MFARSSEALPVKAPILFKKRSDTGHMDLVRPLNSTKPAPAAPGGHVLDPLAASAATLELARGEEFVEQGEEAKY